MRPWLVLLTCVVFLSAAIDRAHAWADGGHKVIALIAWTRLEPAQREWVVTLLQQHPLWDEHFRKPMEHELGERADEDTRQQWIFAQAAVWPDIIRGPRESKVNPWEQWHRPFWHYIDLPVFTSEETRVELEAKARTGATAWEPGRAEFLEAKNNAVQTLKKALHELADPSAPAPQRAVMLCWLFHLVGDMHQPCHCATLYDAQLLPTGDRGGNSTSIEGLPDAPLHAYWDNLLGRPGTQLNKAHETANSLMADAALQKTAATDTGAPDPETWVKESNVIAHTHVYPTSVLAAVKLGKQSEHERNGQKFSGTVLQLGGSDLAAYQESALQLARKRALLAADRLAAALKQIAKP